MKYIILHIFLILVISTNAQNNSDTAKLQHYPVDVENKFILPEYSNQILDAEKIFSENEIQFLHKSIDSIFKSTKLHLSRRSIMKMIVQNLIYSLLPLKKNGVQFKMKLDCF